MGNELGRAYSNLWIGQSGRMCDMISASVKPVISISSSITTRVKFVLCSSAISAEKQQIG